MAPQFNASTIVSDDNFVIPFPGSLSTPERRKTLCVGRLPFRPRRASDYDWLGDLANDPLDVFLWHPFLLSSILHVTVLFLLCHCSLRFHSSRIAPIEVDLTGPYEVVPADMARLSKPIRKGDPEGIGKALEAPDHSSSVGISQDSSHDSSHDTEARKGSITGTQEGAEVALISLTAFPKLINRQDLSASLRRFYPEAERRAGQEASVVLDLHVSSSGNVTQTDVVRSGGLAFDQAAIQVAKLFQFSPARVGDKPVPVKVRQTISFRLEN